MLNDEQLGQVGYVMLHYQTSIIWPSCQGDIIVMTARLVKPVLDIYLTDSLFSVVRQRSLQEITWCLLYQNTILRNHPQGANLIFLLRFCLT